LAPPQALLRCDALEAATRREGHCDEPLPSRADDMVACSEENRQREAMRSRQITERLGVTRGTSPTVSAAAAAAALSCFEIRRTLTLGSVTG